MLPLHNHIQNDPVSKNKEYVICKNLTQKHKLGYLFTIIWSCLQLYV